jgi:bacterioferritin-associated ferredoxin
MPLMTLDEALEKLPDILKKDLQQNLCVCNSVPKIKIIQTIVDGADTLEKVQKTTYASDGNGCCKREVERLIEVITEK